MNDIDELKAKAAEIEEEWRRVRQQARADTEAREGGLTERYPLGLPVRDKDGRTGVVVGYREGKVLVQETGVPTAEDRPSAVAIAPEHLAPVHPRPSRYELLAAVEEAILRVARDRPVSGTVESQARAVLTLAQARALL